MTLVDVDLRTLLGKRYLFPDMPKDEIDMVVDHARHGDACQTLTVHNVSGAVMVMPWRIVSSIRYNGEVVWTRQSSTA